ncbi:MAG: hypothetical protein WBF20_06510 [Trebonia sp.]|uniref:hypothetical protein n=1 Tax=Trebonia sp. TaxID=2767075 RepID=UPI003C77AB03
MPRTVRFATSTPHTTSTPSPAAVIGASARLRWYVRPSGAWDHHRASHLPSVRARPARPTAAAGADPPAVPIVTGATPVG